MAPQWEDQEPVTERRAGWKRIIAAALAVGALSALAGCAGGEAPGAVEASPPPEIGAATNRPLTTPTARAGSATAIPVDEYGLPLDLTGYELIAARAGEAVYSGYACVIAPVGCACEQPVLERVTFTFDPAGHMDYAFAGDGYAATWRMTRLGASQWGYTQGYTLEGTDIRVAHIILLTFTASGFIRNDGADLSDGTIVTCPDVTYRRLAMPTPAPEP